MTVFWMAVTLIVVAAGGYGAGFVHGMSSEASRESSDEEFIAEVRRLDIRHRESHARHAAGRERVPLK